MFFGDLFRVDGEEHGGAAYTQQPYPFLIQRPGDAPGVAGAVGVGKIEGAVLHHPEGQGVDAHLPGPLPFHAAGVVAGPLELKDSGSQMRDGVAADDDGVSRAPADGPVKGENDLRGGLGPVIEVPAALKHLPAHLEAPEAEDVGGRKIVLQKSVAPAYQPAGVRLQKLQHLGVAGVQDEGVVAAAAVHQQLFGHFRVGGQGPVPDAGEEPHLGNFRCQSRHVREIGVAAVPGARVAGPSRVSLPAVVDDHIGPGGEAIGQLLQKSRVPEDLTVGAFAVGVVPVVAAVDDLLGKSGLGAHGGAEGSGCPEGGLAGDALSGDDGGGVKGSALQFHRVRAAAQVQAQLRIKAVQPPGAEAAAAGHNAVAVGKKAVGHQHIPGHDPLRPDAHPLQVAVGPLPGIAQDFCALRGRSLPAHINSAKRRGLGGDEDFSVGGEGDGYILKVKAAIPGLHGSFRKGCFCIDPGGQPGQIVINHVISSCLRGLSYLDYSTIQSACRYETCHEQ